jgi:hypothetical protein
VGGRDSILRTADLLSVPVQAHPAKQFWSQFFLEPKTSKICSEHLQFVAGDCIFPKGTVLPDSLRGSQHLKQICLSKRHQPWEGVTLGTKEALFVTISFDQTPMLISIKGLKL